MLIWDTVEYSILPYKKPGEETDGEMESDGVQLSFLSDSEKLHLAFQNVRVLTIHPNIHH